MATDQPIPPVILVVDDATDSRERLTALLERRYAADYDVMVALSPHDGLRRLDALRDDGREVALILADQRMAGMSGVEFLARATDLLPEAIRVVVVGWGGLEEARDEIRQAAALGQIETYVARPWRDADEAFHHAVSKFLEEWDRTHRPQYEAIRIVGERWDAYTQALRDALHRSGVPFGFYEVGTERADELLASARADLPLPVAILFDGRVLARPTAIEIATAMGVNTEPGEAVFDLAIVGSGPAGLAAAVYASSEGLSVLVVEHEALGGQASTSSMIRNYLGFPRGLSGADLAARAYRQAWFFGTQFLIGRRAAGLRVEADRRVLVLDGGSEVRSRAVMLATGVSYRRLRAEQVEELVGRGVYYGAPVTEAPGMKGQDVVVVGGGNSSAQMGLYVARFAAHVTLVTRNPALSEMSAYLVREIESRPNITVRVNTVVAGARGDARLHSLQLRDTVSGDVQDVPTAAVFIMIGAEPRTDWLPAEVEREERGYVLTGDDVSSAALSVAGVRKAAPLETSLPGVFAVGDVRNGALKRIAAAVGEGATAVRMVHEYLAELRRAAEVAPTAR
jgi:thioredoxin reductase (NADPH)